MDATGFWQRRNPFNRRRLLTASAAGAAAIAGLSIGCAGRRTASPSQAPAPSGAGTPRSGGTYNFYIATNATLDPLALSQVSTDAVAGGVMSRLFRFKTGPDPKTITNHDVENDLAISAESPDAMTWTFKLRPDAKFHNVAPVNGHPVEAEDVKSTFTRALSLPQNPNRGSIAMVNADQIEAPDATTVVFKLNYPYAPFTKIVASPIYAWIFPREALAGSYDPSKTAIGSGPFMLQSATPDVAFVLQKNPAWFESGRPYIDSVNLAVVPDTAQQIAQFSSGHIDEVSVGADDLPAVKARNPKATVLTIAPSLAGSVYMQLASPAFQDVRVRQAMSMSLDYDAVQNAIFNNQATRTLFVQPTLGKWALGLDQLDAGTAQYYKYNLPQAKQLLQTTGVLDQTFKYAYIGSGGGISAQYWYPKEATSLQNMLAAAGLKLDQVPIDWSRDFLDQGKGYRQGFFPPNTMMFSAQQPFTEVDEMLFNFFDSKSTQSETNVRDLALDDMLSKARTIVNEDDRLQAYLNIEKYIASKVYVLIGPGGYTYTVVQPRVKNFQVGSQQGELVETYTKLWLEQ